MIADFETGSSGWQAEDARVPIATVPVKEIAGAVSVPSGFVHGAGTHAAAQGSALRIPLDFPQPATVFVCRSFDWSNADRLAFEIFLPKTAPKVQLAAFAKDRALRWYQTADLSEPGKGAWSTVRLDISASSSLWVGKGHYRPWSGYVAQGIAEFGVKLFSKGEFHGAAYLDNVRVERAPQRGSAQPYILNFRVNGTRIEQYQKFEITFELPRTYANPFDPDLIDIRAHFISPTGLVTTVPAFFYQAYLRHVEQSVEELVPIGRTEWKVRFAPAEVGPYTYFIEVIDSAPFAESAGTGPDNAHSSGTGPARLSTQRRTFTSVHGKSRGAIRISARDPRYFEFDNGDFYYPIGQNTVAAFDVRNAANLGVPVHLREGTAAYDRFFIGMGRSRQNFTRVWMSCWSLCLEWSRRYDTQFDGLGRYSLENAWRLDYILELARSRGIYVMLTLDSHGHVMPEEQSESNWAYSPYSKQNGGILWHPSEFFTDEKAWKFYTQRIRYILARWGYSANIFAWEIFNEVDLANYYKDQVSSVAKWHRRAARYIRNHDQGKHVITTNAFYWHKPAAGALWSLPEVEFTSAHLFGPKLLTLFKSTMNRMNQYGKIFLITESGSAVFTPEPKFVESYLHGGLWGSHMLPLAGAAVPWWWVFIADRNLYGSFEALARYAEGEDRRGRDLVNVSLPVMDRDTGYAASGLTAECLHADDLAYVWVADQAKLFKGLPEPVSHPEHMRIQIPGLRPGTYLVEFWDTYTGTVTNRCQVRCGDDGLSVDLPSFECDMALKVKRHTDGT